MPCIAPRTESEKSMLKVYEGRMDDTPVAALYSGVGKVNAAIGAQILIDTYGVTHIINAGVAGGMAQNVYLLDTVVAEQCAHHDMAQDILTEFHPWMPSIYFSSDGALLCAAHAAAQVSAPDTTVHFGTIVTGEAFIADNDRARINGAFAPLAVDMETAAVAQVCRANSIPFLSVRTITDDAAHTGAGFFEKNCTRASALAKDFVVALLRAL